MNTKIYLVMSNQDLSSGAGPMYPVAAFTVYSAAISSAMSQPGVMGRDKKWPGIDSEILEFDGNGRKVARISFEYRHDELEIKRREILNNRRDG